MTQREVSNSAALYIVHSTLNLHSYKFEILDK